MINEIIEQRIAWRERHILTILSYLKDGVDKEVAVELISSAWNECHSEGLQDAASLCLEIVEASEDKHVKRVGGVIHRAIKMLDKMNMETHNKIRKEYNR